MSVQRQNGVYYTTGNPFSLKPFTDWAQSVGLRHGTILEPFAGANNIIQALQALGLCEEFVSYDIRPTNKDVAQHDTLLDFPQNFNFCVTNPPWLARNSASRRRLAFPDCGYDDLYKHCLQLCLDNCAHVAALIPATFLQSGLFRERLAIYILLHEKIFSDTENPVCLALFNPKPCQSTQVYYDNRRIGDLDSMTAYEPIENNVRPMKFNDVRGQLGFIAFDYPKSPSIRFCRAEEIAHRPVKVSSRFNVRIGVELNELDQAILELNAAIQDYRRQTKDLFLTPFKGIRSDGMYRRRMDFAMARRFINAL